MKTACFRRVLPLLATASLAFSGCTQNGGSSSSSGNPGNGPGSAGSSDGDGGHSSGPAGSSALPEGTLLYLRADTADSDVLIARDLQEGTERVVTDLRGDGSDGWHIRGYSVSPDRTRIALASLYGPTKDDNDTRLATRRIWTLAADGSDMRRLTPTFPNTSQGRSQFTIEVNNPLFSADGSSILYDFGNYWYEGTKLLGGSLPWTISTAGDALPELFPTVTNCTVIYPARNPATGDILFNHSVCTNTQDEGLFLYPAGGGTAPKKLVAYSYAPDGVAPSLETPSWIGDGSGFVFVGRTTVDRENGNSEVAPCLFLYDMAKATASPLVVPPSGAVIASAAIAPDATSIVYCLRDDDANENLHLIDLTASTPTDTAITTDGKSCNPSF
ncbi:MAG: putative secreted protein [Labilithrix sp.]|nr:putative secreted protein [Labilithrix sp.]